MSIVWEMLAQLFHRESGRHSRVEAAATLVMWFAAGAFVTSTVAPVFGGPPEPSQLVDAAGGLTAAVMAIICKAV
jgi:hypothetical protein